MPLLVRPFDPGTLPVASSPLDFGVCVAYYNAQVLSSLWQDSARTTAVAADSDPIGSFDDLTGDGNHLLSGSASLKPSYDEDGLNGLGALLFDGDDRPKTSIAEFNTAGLLSVPYTLVVVAALGTTGAMQCLLDRAYGGVNGAKFETVDDGGTTRYQLIAGASLVASGTTVDTGVHLHVGLVNGASSEYWLDGTSIASGNAGSNDFGGVAMGGRNGGTGRVSAGTLIGAAAIYDGDIGSTARAQLLAWAQSTFGTP